MRFLSKPSIWLAGMFLLLFAVGASADTAPPTPTAEEVAPATPAVSNVPAPPWLAPVEPVFEAFCSQLPVTCSEYCGGLGGKCTTGGVCICFADP